MAFFLIVPSVMIVSIVMVHALAKRLGLKIYYITLAAVAVLSFMVVFAAVILSSAPDKKFLLHLGILISAASLLLTFANRFLIKKQRAEEKNFTEEVKAAYAAELKKDSTTPTVEEAVDQVEKFEWGDELSLPESADKASADKSSTDKISADKTSADKISADKISAEKTSADKISADKTSADKISTNKNSADKISADKTSADKISTDKNSADKNSADKNSADKNSADKISADKTSADKISADKTSADKTSTDKNSADKSSTDKSSTDKVDPLEDFPLEDVFKPLSEVKQEEIPEPPKLAEKPKPEENFPLEDVFRPLSAMKLDKLEHLPADAQEEESEEAIDTLDDILDRAYSERAKGHVWQAIELYKKALERYRGDEYAPFVAIDLGNIYKEQALYSKAIKIYEEALRLPAVMRNASIKKEFVKNLEYLRIVRDILLKHHALSIPFAKLSRGILREIEVEFQAVQMHSAQAK